MEMRCGQNLFGFAEDCTNKWVCQKIGYPQISWLIGPFSSQNCNQMGNELYGIMWLIVAVSENVQYTSKSPLNYIFEWETRDFLDL